MNPNTRDANIPMTKLSKPLFTRLLSDIMVPNVMDMTGPMRGETNMAATMFEALFSTRPNAARELKQKFKIFWNADFINLQLPSSNQNYR